ncbi:MAG: hypothetical protein C0623_03640 [Desulfuromonas sp.]|nr:MAG: hypothetical protein C0623_03640 [Desulfuromonas sp.]
MEFYRSFAWLPIALFVSGCAMSWQPQVDASRASVPTAQSASLTLAADQCFARADNMDKLAQCEQDYLGVLQANPGDYHALTQLSTINILVGTAYTEGTSAKSKRFQKAMSYAEQAMYINPEFRQRVAAGESIWDASDSLTEAEAEAMFFWVTALQYEFKEAMNLPEKIVNIKWMQKALVFIERVEAVDPDFGGGGVQFAKAICYYALPKAYGGSKELGDRAMQAAVDHDPDWLLPRWARAKYYYVITDQPDKSKQELGWVASRNPDNFRDPLPWRIHFIESSAALLQR